ncbi:MAG: hypothetical protein M1819_004157 [Sarea resinae]|nr:MAG: hypothetical protein M1819_004157 [Sarea resinae]
MVIAKHELEAALHAEKREISDGTLKEDNPLDFSENFQMLCEACRRGDLKLCQEMITSGANINARDRFDYSPLILASLCGHYEVVQLLLESGALCERDTFQGERCLYNALNDRIRNLLLQYDYSKSTDPLQPLASHITSLLHRDHPSTSDIEVSSANRSFRLHKFILSARSPYFRKKLAAAPESTSWKLSSSIPPQAFEIAIRYLYLGEVSLDTAVGYENEEDVLAGVEKLSRQLEIRPLFEGLLEGGDRRIVRQRRADEVNRGRDQLESWFKDNVVKHKVFVDSSKADDVRWDRHNGIFADVLLRADDDEGDEEQERSSSADSGNFSSAGIPVGPLSNSAQSTASKGRPRMSTLFPVHRAMLIRSEFFLTMFSSPFRESQQTDYLQIIPVDCSPDVLQVVLRFLYTETADISLGLAVDVLFAADLLLIEKLKAKAAVVISTLGNGPASVVESVNSRRELDESEELDIYDIIRAGWLTRVHRLEEFGARYIAVRLENYIDQEEFAELIRESAARIKHRQETDSIELLDDIRYYLSERFRLRFEDSGIEEMMDENGEIPAGPVLEEVPSLEGKVPEDEGVDVSDQVSRVDAPKNKPKESSTVEEHIFNGAIRTLDGEIAGDEFAQDAVNYQILLGKIDALLENLKLDA